jgi:hypothetical protein
MSLSPQFRALGRIAGFFASAWAAIGVIVGLARAVTSGGGELLTTIAIFGVEFGLAGGISGIVTSLLVARLEAGHDADALSTWRLAAWGVLGGLAPAALFGALGAAFGAGTGALVPLLGLGIFGGATGGVIAGGAGAVAHRAELPPGPRRPELPPG